MTTAFGTAGNPSYVDPFKPVAPPPPAPVSSLPPPSYTGPVNMSINNTQQGVDLATSNQQQAAAIGVKIPGADFTPSTTSTQTSPTSQTPTTSPNTNTTDPNAQALKDAQAQRAQQDADYRAQAQQVHDTILNIQNGTTPLSSGQQAQIDGLKQQFQVMIDQQNLVNKGASGLGNIRGYQKGAAEYDPSFQVKTIGAIVSAGQQKIADLNIKMASAVASLTQAFHDSDIKAVQSAWGVYQDAAKQHSETLQKTVQDAQDAIKTAQEQAKRQEDQQIEAAKQEKKDTYDQVTKPINDLKAKVLTQGAPQSVADMVGAATSVDDALTAAGGWLQTADGDLGRYLDYKRQGDATGKTVASYSDWLAADEAAKSKQKSTDAYNVAYATARGKAAGTPASTSSTIDPATGQPVVLKPLTEVQAKDFTYAQRGSNASDIINGLQDKIVSMDALTYTLQKSAEKNDIANQFVSNDIRQLRQAERDFATAILRRESGAAISTGEFNTVEAQYFPRPGDDAQTIAQKTALRDTAINSFKANVPDYDSRIQNTPGAILDHAEKVATASLTSFKTSHPEKVAEVDSRIQSMEKTLGRPISATDFLQAFPEYK